MPDAHFFKADWGLRPVLFQIGTIPVPAYTVTALLGIVAALLLYRYTVRHSGVPRTGDTWLIPLLALFFGTMGAKLPTVLSLPSTALSPGQAVAALTSGKTIVGGLIGGWIGVVLAKRLTGIRERRGNQFAPALAFGLAFGRVGCLMQGCCYGIATRLPWGIDLGDGVLRHPVQAYEILFHLTACILLLKSGVYRKSGGIGLKLYFISYLCFRFLAEFLRTEPRILLGLTGYQWAALLFVPALAYAVVREAREPASEAFGIRSTE